MSIAQNFSTTSPSLSLDFANVQALDPRISFSRATTATYYGTRTALAEQNLLLQSQTFETTWNAINATVGVNSTIAPDGTITAESFTPTATSGTHSLQQSAGTIGVQCTFSVFAKSNGYTNIQLFADSSGNFNATFDLTAGTAASTGGAVVSIVNVGSGWYRCIATFTQTASTRLNISGFPTGATASNFGNTFTGDGTSGVFLWGAQLEQRSTVTAYQVTTTQPVTNYIPVLETAASGVARFDHNPTTFESLGLLIEEQRTNLLTYSEQFDNAAWVKLDATATANTIIAPDGTLTGDQITGNGTTNPHFIRQTISATGSTIHTFSLYLKQGTERYAYLVLLGRSVTDDNGDVAWIDLQTGTISTSTGSGTSATITLVGNGWYRVTMPTSAYPSSAQIEARVGVTSVSGGQATLVSGYIFAWGAQLEAGAFSTSYIPTVASQVTRAADAASMTGTNFSSWYNQAQGTLYVDAKKADFAGLRIAAVNDNTANNRMDIIFDGNEKAIVITNNVLQAQLNPTNLFANQYNKAAFSYQSNLVSMSLNNSIVVTDTSNVIPVVDRLFIGSRDGVSFFINGTIKKVSYYPIRLSDANLQALTT